MTGSLELPRVEALQTYVWRRHLASAASRLMSSGAERPEVTLVVCFVDIVGYYGIARSEGIVLRYLANAFKAMRQTVPDDAKTDELKDLIEWLGELVRQTDSSLVDEWEALESGAPTAAEPTPGDVTGAFSVTADARGFRVMVRNAMFRRVDLLARRRWEDLAALDPGLSAEQWQAAGEAYAAEHGDVGTLGGGDGGREHKPDEKASHGAPGVRNEPAVRPPAPS